MRLSCGHREPMPGPCGAPTGRLWCTECGESRAIEGNDMKWRMRRQDDEGRWSWVTYEPRTASELGDLAIEVAHDHHRHLAPAFLAAYVESMDQPFRGQAPSTFVALENLAGYFSRVGEDELFREVFGSLLDIRERLDYWGA